MKIALTAAERADFIAQVRKEFVAELISQHKQDFDLISPAQAAGILDVAPNTLRNIAGLNPITIIPRKVIKYKLSEIKALLE